MSVTTVINITSGSEPIAMMQSLLQKSGSPHEAANLLQDYLSALCSGSRKGQYTCQVQNGDAVAASGTVTCASVLAADTVTICGQVLTAHASTQDGTHFVVGVDDTHTAQNLVTCIGANTTLSPLVSAKNALGVVTVSAKESGLSGNGYTLASSSNTTLAVSGALLSGGSADTGSVKTYHLGV